MVETGGLENRLRGDSHGGSNPSSSANLGFILNKLSEMMRGANGPAGTSERACFPGEKFNIGCGHRSGHEANYWYHEIWFQVMGLYH